MLRSSRDLNVVALVRLQKALGVEVPIDSRVRMTEKLRR